MAGALSVGTFAQLVVQPPPSGFGTTPSARVETHVRPKPSKPVVAVALDAQGTCKYSTDGKSFHHLKKNMLIPQGATVRTGSSGNTDLFLRRMGATVRVKPDSEVRLDQLEQKADQHKELNTVVNVRKGRLFTVIHTNVPGSSLDIKNSAGQSLTDTVAGGRYIVSASSIENAGPEKLPAGASASGEFDEKMSAAIKEQMEFDEVEALAETWANTGVNPGLEP
jgi:hypothetical protein